MCPGCRLDCLILDEVLSFDHHMLLPIFSLASERLRVDHGCFLSETAISLKASCLPLGLFDAEDADYSHLVIFE